MFVLTDIFLKLKVLVSLLKKMVQLKKDKICHFVYWLMKLALLSPFAATTVELVLSAMKFIKNSFCNRMADELMNDCLGAYIEKNIFDSIDNESIILQLIIHSITQ